MLYLRAFARLEAIHLEIEILAAEDIGKLSVLAAQKRLVHELSQSLVLSEGGKMTPHYLFFDLEELFCGTII